MERLLGIFETQLAEVEAEIRLRSATIPRGPLPRSVCKVSRAWDG
jgi:hypothetical protein